MITCFAVDDQKQAVQRTIEYIRRTNMLQLVGFATHADEALRQIARCKPQLVFLDINMEDMNGVEQAHIIHATTGSKIIFVTASSDYALTAFNIGVIDYLLKPFDFTRFMRAVTRAVVHIEKEQLLPPANEITEKTFILLPAGRRGRQEKIMIPEIDYVQSARNYVYFYCRHEKRMFHASLSHIQEQLPATQFVRIHSSYLVARNRIKAVDARRVALTTGATLPVGPTYRSLALKAIKEE
jgi:two-component system, LytTR family, response regulator